MMASEEKRFEDELTYAFLLSDRVSSAVDEAESFKRECAEVGKHVERISQMLRTIVRLTATTPSPYQRPIRRIVAEASKNPDDVLESLPEIDDRYLSLPRMSSLKTLQQDDKLNFQNLGSGNFDWASLAGLHPVTELVSGNQTQAQSQEPASFNNSDMYVPSIPPVCHGESSLKRLANTMDEEVQSGLRNQRVDNSGFFQNYSNVLTQNYSNSLDPYGFKYPTHTTTGFGFRQ